MLIRLWTESGGLVGLRYWAERAEGPATTGRKGSPSGARRGMPAAWQGGRVQRARQAEAQQAEAQQAEAQQAGQPWTTGWIGHGPEQADRERTPTSLKPRRSHRKRARADQRPRPAG